MDDEVLALLALQREIRRTGRLIARRMGDLARLRRGGCSRLMTSSA